MSRDAPRRHDEILGARVVLTGWAPKRLDEVSQAIRTVMSQDVDLTAVDLPFVVLAKVSLERAETARALLTEAGATIELEDAWVTRDTLRPVVARPECPFCGSGRTQPYGHAGPAAKKNMKCTTCGRTFRVTSGPGTR